MKVTIELSESDLKQYLEETKSFNAPLILSFPIRQGSKMKKIKELLLYSSDLISEDPLGLKEMKKIEKSVFGNKMINMPYIYSKQFKVIKIEP